MKKFFALLLLIVAFSATVNAQILTNKDYYQKVSPNDPNAEAITWSKTITFKIDSTVGVYSYATPKFEIPFNGEDFYDTVAAYSPLVFKKKIQSTSAGMAPKIDIFVQGVYDLASDTDTLTLDTLTYASTTTTENDSVGIFNLNNRRAPEYKIFIRCLNAQVQSGKITIMATRRYTGRAGRN